MPANDRPLKRFDTLGVPAVIAASVIMVMMSLVLFLLPPVGVVDFGATRTNALEYTVEDPGGNKSAIALEFSANGEFAVGIPITLAKIILAGAAPSGFNNSEVVIDGRLTGEEATGVIAFRATRTFFLFGNPISVITGPDFSPPSPSFQLEAVGSMTFRSPGYRNVTGEFAVTVSNVLDRFRGETNSTTFSGTDSETLQVSEASTPSLERISFYGAALAVLTTGLALPSSARGFRDLWVKRRAAIVFGELGHGGLTVPAWILGGSAFVSGLLLIPVSLGTARISPLLGLTLFLFGVSLVLYAVLFGIMFHWKADSGT